MTPGLSPDGLVTGEAVPVDLRIARLPSRGLAFGIDAAVQLAALAGVAFVAGALLENVEEAWAAALGLVLTVAVLVGYPATVETLTRGRSLGKLALGLRVVRSDAGPVRFRHALVRALLGFFVDGWMTLGVVGTLTATVSRRGQRVGDIVAGTIVVQERVAVRDAGPVGMPPPLAAWASGADLSCLPDELALSVRQFLARAPGLDPAARDVLGERLVAAVAAVVSPPPPPGTPGPAYLAAVLAERRRREELRLQRESGATRAPAVPATPDTAATPAPEGRTAPPATRRAETAPDSAHGGFAPPV